MNIFGVLPVAMLSQSESFIIGPITKAFSLVLNIIFDLVYQVTTANSLALTIIIFTLLVKFIMMPLMINQQKSMRRMQEIQPQLQKIQKKYENKKDPESQQKMQAEMQKLYQKHKVNPLSGCLPLFIQFPIFIALYQVFRYAPAYITQLTDLYAGIANQIMGVEGYASILEQIQEAYKSIVVQNYDAAELNKVIDLIYQFPIEAWNQIYTKMPEIAANITPSVDKVKDITMFLGIIDLSVATGWAFPGLILPLIAGGATFLQSRLMTARSQRKNQQTNDTAMQTQKVMNFVFPVMMLFISATTPAGLSIYWITSNLFQIVQQAIINRVMDKEEEKRQEELKKLKAKKERARRKKASQPQKSVSNQTNKSDETTNKSKDPTSSKNKPTNETEESVKEEIVTNNEDNNKEE